jgi:hypothetical protein
VLTSSYDGGRIELRARMHKSDFERMKKLALEAGGEVVEGLQ